MNFTKLAIAAGVLVGIAAPIGLARAATIPTRPLITHKIDDSRLVTLAGNTRPEAVAANDRGRVTDSMALDHLMLELRRPAGREAALEKFMAEQTDPKSPNYHRWLTARELGEEYGPAPSDIGAIEGWLKAHGFTVNGAYPSGMTIDFSGTAGQVRAAFHTEIHHLTVDGADHIANMSDPQIPAALAPATAGIVSLNDFRPHPMYRARPKYTFGCGSGNCTYAVVPADVYTIYNFNPLLAEDSGQGQTLVAIEDSDVYKTSDWDTFRSTFGLTSAYPDGSFAQIHPGPGPGGNCADPGANADDVEANLDAEWLSVGAPSAAVEVAACKNTRTNFGGFIAMQNLLDESNPPKIISISYGESEPLDGAAFNGYINTLYGDAAAEGVSIFVASGDEGAASSDYNKKAATHGIAVSGFASTPYNVAAGGTDFGDTAEDTNSLYWSPSNGFDYESALSYVPEIPWNNSCASTIIASYLGFDSTYGKAGFCNQLKHGLKNYFLTVTAGSGGPSGCATGAPAKRGIVGGSCTGYSKPPWQSVYGNPNDHLRDIPDVSLFAANGIWSHYYVLCYSDRRYGGAPCTGTPDTWAGAGGTSFSAPLMAGIQALINQRIGGSFGNPDPFYYSLAAEEYGSGGDSACDSSLGSSASNSCIFYDITAGDMDVDCKGKKTSECYRPSGGVGVLSTTNTGYAPSYTAAPGWDFATGIGSVNAYNLVTAASEAAKAPPHP
ncbi:MAG: S53 family peptidase [Candidatus Binataceae bacterium]